MHPIIEPFEIGAGAVATARHQSRGIHGRDLGIGADTVRIVRADEREVWSREWMPRSPAAPRADERLPDRVAMASIYGCDVASEEKARLETFAEQMEEAAPSPRIDGASLRRATPFDDMTDAEYQALRAKAMRAAARGRAIGSSRIDADVALPPPTSMEDDETAVDAIGDAWFAMATAKRPGPSDASVRRRALKRAARDAMRAKLGMPPLLAPVPRPDHEPLTMAIAQRLGERRSQHRIRRYRAGLAVSTDHVMPRVDASATLAELVAAVPESRRAEFQAALAGRDEHRHRARTLRKILGKNGAEKVFPVSAV